MMKVLVLYRPNSEFARVTEEFIHDFEHRTALQKLEVLSLDTREGSSTATIYDVMSYPAILVIGDDGSLHKSWEGHNLPLIDEVVAYSRV
jgi:hypothetical protein